jgi:hypothetical protein
MINPQVRRGAIGGFTETLGFVSVKVNKRIRTRDGINGDSLALI